MTESIALQVIEGVFYLFANTHRHKNPNKSQWSITPDEERICFQEAFSTRSLVNDISDKCWGLHIIQDQCMYLGEVALNSSKKDHKLIIAKFVDGGNDNRWHGYPADHVNFPDRDIPSEEWLNYWMQRGQLKKSKVSKILGGKKCSL